MSFSRLGGRISHLSQPLFGFDSEIKWLCDAACSYLSVLPGCCLCAAVHDDNLGNNLPASSQLAVLPALGSSRGHRGQLQTLSAAGQCCVLSHCPAAGVLEAYRSNDTKRYSLGIVMFSCFENIHWQVELIGQFLVFERRLCTVHSLSLGLACIFGTGVWSTGEACKSCPPCGWSSPTKLLVCKDLSM